MPRLASLALLALLVVACGGQSPTPTPTVARTPVATPSARPSATVSAEFQRFVTHVALASGDFAAATREIARTAQANDVAGLRLALRDALDLSADELAWLRANQPETCYRPAHEGWRQAMLKYQEAFEAIDYGLTPPITVSDIQRGTGLMSEGNELVDTATLLVELTSC